MYELWFIFWFPTNHQCQNTQMQPKKFELLDLKMHAVCTMTSMVSYNLDSVNHMQSVYQDCDRSFFWCCNTSQQKTSNRFWTSNCIWQMSCSTTTPNYWGLVEKELKAWLKRRNMDALHQLQDAFCFLIISFRHSVGNGCVWNSPLHPT